VLLSNGGALVIELTAAATMIDVDSGAGARGGKAHLATNLSAALEVARQIHLRNLAGPIVIDFIGMRDRRERERVRDALAAALADDIDTEVLGSAILSWCASAARRRWPSCYSNARLAVGW
jgi:ribonuclease G